MTNRNALDKERLALIIATQYHDAECPDDRCTPTAYAHLIRPARKAVDAIYPAIEQAIRDGGIDRGEVSP